MNLLNSLLAHPLTKNMSVDDPLTTEKRHQIIQGKKFLKKIYEEWYKKISVGLHGAQVVLEIGSGAGFFKKLIPGLITSEVMLVKNIDLVADATQLPFANHSLDAIVMTDVLHHIPEPQLLFAEANRCLRDGGKVLMIEPWPTRWSELIYQNLHHEPFNKDGDWAIPKVGPLSGANGALPWILFDRDKADFAALFPRLKIAKVQPMMPFSYLASGGVSLRFSAPSFLYGVVRYIESKLDQRKWAMFAYIEIELI